jgi:hypothetical protein
VLASMLLALVAFVPQDAPKDDAAQRKSALEQAQLWAKSLVAGDFAKIIDLTNPAVVKDAGGKDNMLKQAAGTVEQMKKQGIVIKEVSVEPPQSISRLKKTLYCIVPKTTVTTFQDFKVTAKNFLLGTSTDEGKTWTFMLGDLGEPGVRKFLPDLPNDMKFPAKVADKVEKTEAEKTKN